MFDILFGWRKASKCKKLIKMLKCRLKLLKNKRCCIAKQLREDVAELLKHGHHQTAFERVEQLIRDESMVQLYDLLDQFCEFILFHLPYIRKSRDCPNDINEAVSTLIFSSARFGELPELMSIRKLFGERYGQRFIVNAIELRPGNLVKHQIKENLYIKKVSDDLKYRLLAEIASSSMQQGPLFLEYKPEHQQHLRTTEGSNQLSCGEVQTQNNYEAEPMGGEQNLTNTIQYFNTDRQMSTEPTDCYEMDNFTIYRRESYEIESSWESSAAKSSEEIICLDVVVEEIIWPVSKNGNHQDQRLFVFKSFGTCPLNEMPGCEIDINHQNPSEENGIVTTYYGESENEILVQDSPLLGLKERKIQCGFGFLKPEDNREGKRIRQYGLRAVTMPAERPKENLTNNNIIRSVSFPYEQPFCGYSSGRHIHPKLPDYDELAAKFKELKRANLRNDRL